MGFASFEGFGQERGRARARGKDPRREDDCDTVEPVTEGKYDDDDKGKGKGKGKGKSKGKSKSKQPGRKFVTFTTSFTNWCKHSEP